MKFSKLATVTIMVSILTISGCSATTEKTTPPTKTATATSAQSLVRETVDTMCALSGKTTITTKDIVNFRTMADKLEAYKGANEESMKATAEQLDGFADNYELVTDVELPSEISKQFVDGCVQVEESYAEAYGNPQ